MACWRLLSFDSQLHINCALETSARNGPTVKAMTVVGEEKNVKKKHNNSHASLGHQSWHAAEGGPVGREHPRDNADSRLTSSPPSDASERVGGSSEPHTPDKIFNFDLKGYFTITRGPPCLFFLSVFFPSTAFNLLPSDARFTEYCSWLPLALQLLAY